MASDGIRVYCDVPFFEHPEWTNEPRCTREKGHEDVPVREGAAWGPEDHAAYGRFFWADSPNTSELLNPRDIIAYDHAHQRLGWLNGIERVRLLDSGRVRMPTDICALIKRGRPLGQPMYPTLAIVDLSDFIEMLEGYKPYRRSA